MEKVKADAGRQVVTLHTLDGTRVVPGDSGGGVWLHGRLVGNLWSRLVVQDLAGNMLGSTDLMVASIHSAGLLAAAEPN